MPDQQQIPIKFTDNQLAGVYATSVNISYTQEEVVFDFMNLLPNSPAGQLIQRIIVSPDHAKRLNDALSGLIQKYDNKESVQPSPVASTADGKIGFDLSKISNTGN